MWSLDVPARLHHLRENDASLPRTSHQGGREQVKLRGHLAPSFPLRIQFCKAGAGQARAAVTPWGAAGDPGTPQRWRLTQCSTSLSNVECCAQLRQAPAACPVSIPSHTSPPWGTQDPRKAVLLSCTPGSRPGARPVAREGRGQPDPTPTSSRRVRGTVKSLSSVDQIPPRSPLNCSGSERPPSPSSIRGRKRWIPGRLSAGEGWWSWEPPGPPRPRARPGGKCGSVSLQGQVRGSPCKGR